MYILHMKACERAYIMHEDIEVNTNKVVNTNKYNTILYKIILIYFKIIKTIL